MDSILLDLEKLVSTSQSVVSGPTAFTSPGNLLEMTILRPHPRPTYSETLGGASNELQQAQQVIPMHKMLRTLDLPKTIQPVGSKFQQSGSRACC